MGHLENIYEKLNLTKENGLLLFGDKLDIYPSRIKNALKQIDYDAIYNYLNKPIIIFKEFNSIDYNTEEKILELYNKIWNLSETLIIFIVLPQEIRLYKGSIFQKDTSPIWKIIYFGFNYDSELKELSYNNIYSGEFFNKYKDEFNIGKDVYSYLLKNLETARNILHDDYNVPYVIVHNIIGRLLFTRFLIDRGFLKRSFFKERYSKDFEEIILNKENLYDYFNYLHLTFNGDLFPEIENEKNSLNSQHLMIFYKLFKGSEISTGQTTLFDIYNFSIIPVELISNIYEKFLDKRDILERKAYYTPLYLVDYILDNNLDKILNVKNTCKVLDPACGSGVFLVEALRRLIEKNYGTIDYNINNIVTDNIFGIDKDEDAINISIFSIYLTLLDYQEEYKIDEYKFPILKYTNFFVSDFFDETASFNDILKKVNMDLIVGNPPWGSEDSLHLKYCHINSIPISYKQIAESFLIRVGDFAKKDTKISLIITSKILYNKTGEEFRKYFLNIFDIEQILEFSLLRKDIFSVIGPGIIISYHKSVLENNFIQHITLRPNKIFLICKKIIVEKYDIKYIPKQLIIQKDWVLATALHGSMLDVLFINRLKSNYKTLSYVIEENKLLHGQGFQKVINSGDHKDATHLINKKYIDSNKNIIKPFFVDLSYSDYWKEKFVHRPRNLRIFEPPLILFKRAPNKYFEVISSFCNEEVVFTHSITSIKGKIEDTELLRNIVGIINSDLISYYLFMIGSSSGVERNLINEYEKLSIPIVIDKRISLLAQNLEEIVKNNINNYEDIYDYKIMKNELNEIIYEIYNVNENEKELIKYFKEVLIYNYIPNEIEYNYNIYDYLNNYAKIFYNYFSNLYNGPEKYFKIDIYITQFFSAMNFQVVNDKYDSKIIFNEDFNVNKLIEMLGILSIYKLSDSLYIDKDVKGFEAKSFYVLKPNNYQNWHKLRALMDLSEFVNEMLKLDLENMVIS